MQFSRKQTVILLSLLAPAPARAIPPRPPAVRVPGILVAVSHDLGIPHEAASNQARTVLSIAKAIALLNVRQGHQSPLFEKACRQIVREINAGGLAPGSLWRHFAVGRLVSGIDLPQRILRGGRDQGRATFSAADFSELLTWMRPTLSRVARGKPKLEEACGRALLVMDMESLLINFWVCGAAHYRQKWLRAPARARYLAANPEIAVISQNRRLRLTLRSYYYRAKSLDYFGMEPLTKPFQLLISHQDHSLTGLKKLLPRLTGLRRFAFPEQYFLQWQLANLCWQMLNFYRAEKHGDALQSLRDYIEHWRGSTHRPLLRWWLGQALRVRGGSPRSVWAPPIVVRLARPHG